MDSDAKGGAYGFDFLVGRWDVANRRLRQRFAGCTDWDEFPGSSTCQRLLGGVANMDEIVMPTRGFSGLTLRLYDVERRQWSLYWANSREGRLFPPVIGQFEGGQGEFYGDDIDEGRLVRVRYIWSGITATSARWEQAFSINGGASWETNWTMQFTRVSA
jgi:hypothetical protein